MSFFPARPHSWDEEVDVLVAGAGAGGMTAGLVAAIEGRKVIVCEKSSQVGGSCARSAGGVWLPGSRQAVEAGSDSSVDQARHYVDGFEIADGAELREAFFESAAPALSYLEKNSHVRFALVPVHPDYRAYEGSSRGGRSLATLEFDGRSLGSDFERLAPPLRELTVLGGMMVGKEDVSHLVHPFGSLRSMVHVARLVGRHLRDRLKFSRGTRLIMGNALAARLFQSLRDRQVPIWMESRVVELLRSGDRVIGAIVKHGNDFKRVRARCGVILATGGFSNNLELKQKLMSSEESRASTFVPSSVEGDGIVLAQAAGGVVNRARVAAPALWFPVSTVHHADGSSGAFPHVFLDRAKPGLIAVNGHAKRFTNEASSYHDFVIDMLRPVGGEQLPVFLICDSHFVKKYGIGMVPARRRNLNKYVDAGYLKVADSLRGLAQQIGLDPASLENTVKEYNGMSAFGVDREFGKGLNEFDRVWGDVSHKPNPCMAPIEQAPYVAVEVHPCDISTFVGLSTSKHGEVLTATEKAIPGLYVCGNDMASIWRGHAPGPGITLGPTLVFAYRAVMHALKGAEAVAPAPRVLKASG